MHKKFLASIFSVLLVFAQATPASASDSVRYKSTEIQVIPKGKYIFEFNKDQSPGFGSSKKNIGGKYCIPCCFDTESFFREKQNKSRQECGCPDIKPISEKNPHHNVLLAT